MLEAAIAVDRRAGGPIGGLMAAPCAKFFEWMISRLRSALSSIFLWLIGPRAHPQQRPHFRRATSHSISTHFSLMMRE